ncbi:RING-type domain-containing protein [Heracleum sosnowskyi]|uniref:RING-type domain-containing protein n=1 Tax=Heracleum sosnowskyi TaxID=360622 RepID=A0AAD8MQ81_9APIA|nr:RING-type domain-containing protein [Heracleum sosnowskyi]
MAIRKLHSEDNTFMILLLFIALLICISHKLNSRFIPIKNLLRYFFKSNTTTTKRYPDGVRQSRYEEEGKKEGEECSVCLYDIKQGDEIMRLPCDHIFHALCLDKWLVSYGHLTCPFCRASLSPSSSPSSGTSAVLYSESEIEVLSFNFFSTSSPSRGRNTWGLM